MARKVSKKEDTIESNNNDVDPIVHLKNEIADRIRKARRAREHTVQYLADSIGLTREALNQIERGKNHVNAVTLYKIATRLDLPIERFFPPLHNEYSLCPKGRALVVEADPESIEWIEEMFKNKIK